MRGLEVEKGAGFDARGSLLCSSPGPGIAGSFRLRLMATLVRRASALVGAAGRLLLELTELRRESCCMPALMVAAAAKETEDPRGDRFPGGGCVLSTPFIDGEVGAGGRLRE